MSESKPKLRQRLEDKARELGFAAIGVARADAAPKSGERLRQWLASGAHGDMIWMEEKADRRASPAGLVAGRAVGDLARHELCARGWIRWRWPTAPSWAGSRSTPRAPTITT